MPGQANMRQVASTSCRTGMFIVKLAVVRRSVTLDVAISFLSVQLSKLPRPQHQPQSHQNQNPEKQLEHAHEPERHGLHELPGDIWPPHGNQPRRPTRHDDEVSDPCNRKQRITDQDHPPGSNGGPPDLFLERVVHGLPTSSRTQKNPGDPSDAILLSLLSPCDPTSYSFSPLP